MIKYEYMTKLSYEEARKQTECNKKDTIIAYYYGRIIREISPYTIRMYSYYRYLCYPCRDNNIPYRKDTL